MSFFSPRPLLRRLSRPCAVRCSSTPQFRPRLEILEDRTVPSGLQIVTTPDVAQSFLNATAILSANNVWAVGETISSIETPFTMHFNGTSWSTVPTPALPKGNFGLLNGVAAVSSNDVWAVGETGNISPFSPLIEHWDGTKWNIVSGPAASGSLNAVTALSASNIWAVGTFGIEHFDGTSWSIIPSPNAGVANLYGVSGTSSTDVWAVGSIGRHPSVEILHWNGQAWSVVPAPSPAFDSSLRSVVALAPNNAWAVGVTNVGPTQTLIEHWNGTSWSVVPSPNAGNGSTNANNTLSGVAAVSASNIWAVGNFTNSNGITQTLTEQFNGTSWSIVSSPNATTNGENTLNGAAALSSGTVVAVGFSIDGTTGDTNNLILAQNGGGASAAGSPLTRIAAVLVNENAVGGVASNRTPASLGSSNEHDGAPTASIYSSPQGTPEGGSPLSRAAGYRPRTVRVSNLVLEADSDVDGLSL